MAVSILVSYMHDAYCIPFVWVMHTCTVHILFPSVQEHVDILQEGFAFFVGNLSALPTSIDNVIVQFGRGFVHCLQERLFYLSVFFLKISGEETVR